MAIRRFAIRTASTAAPFGIWSRTMAISMRPSAPVRPRTLPMIIPCSRLPWSVATRMPTAAIRGLPLSAIRRRTVQSTALASILPVPVLALPTSSSTTTTSISVNTTTRRLPSSASCSTNPTPKRAARAAWVALTARL